MAVYTNVSDLRTRRQLIWRLIWMSFFSLFCVFGFVMGIYNLFDLSLADNLSDNIIFSLIIMLVAFLLFGFALLEIIEAIRRLRKKDYWIKYPYK